MTEDQKEVVDFYSGACIAMFAVVVVWLVIYHFIMYVKKALFGSAKTVGKASSIAYRHVGGIQAYVPVVNRSEFVTPLICANVDNVPLHHLPINYSANERGVMNSFNKYHFFVLISLQNITFLLIDFYLL